MILKYPVGNMDLLKRACLYLVRKKGKTATLLTFLLVMATLVLTCFSIQSATITANTNIKKALLGYFTINAKHLYTGITESVLNQILSIDGLSGNYILRSYSYANYYDTDGKLLEISTEGAAQTPAEYENAGKIVASSNSENDSYFTEGGFKLTEGKIDLVPQTHKRKSSGDQLRADSIGVSPFCPVLYKYARRTFIHLVFQ